MFCPKCGNKINDDSFNYCPKCGFNVAFLHNLIEKPTTSQPKSSASKTTTQTDKKEEDFCSKLNNWETMFIDNFLLRMKSYSDDFVLTKTKHYYAVNQKKDTHLPNFGNQFWFVKPKTILFLKYREMPDTRLKSDQIAIGDYNDLNVLVANCVNIHKNRQKREEELSFENRAQNDNKKDLEPKTSHKNIRMPQRYNSELFAESSSSDVSYIIRKKGGR